MLPSTPTRERKRGYVKRIRRTYLQAGLLTCQLDPVRPRLILLHGIQNIAVTPVLS